MTFEISNKTANDILVGISDFIKHNPSLPARLIYCLNKNKNHIEPILKAVEETRVSLVHKYGEPDPVTKIPKVTEENMQFFIKDYTDILESIVSIDIHQYSVAELEQGVPKIEMGTAIMILWDYIFQDIPRLEVIK